MILEFFKNFGSFLISINVNAFWSIVYLISQNWFIIISLIFVGILAFHEISIKSNQAIDDMREMY